MSHNPDPKEGRQARDAEEFIPWTEKYRPKKLSEVVGHDAVVKRLQAFVKAKNLPHLLFAGPAGCGKTTCILALASELYGDAFRQSFLEFNASVAPETPILVRSKGIARRTTFGDLAAEYFNDDASKRATTDGLEVLACDRDYRVRFLPVSWISRHRVEKIAQIRYEGGVVRTSLEHSVRVMDEHGEVQSRQVSSLKKGDSLITFAEAQPGEKVRLDLSEYAPQEYAVLKSGILRNPRVKHVYGELELDEELAWLFGLYLAEGCVGFRHGTSGQTIFTLGYPAELELAEEVARVVKEHFGLVCNIKQASSGFDRSRMSSIQVRIYNSQLAKFFSQNFYDGASKKNATTKRIPYFFYSAEPKLRTAFLKGYMGDAHGKWNEFVRYSSRSHENLIDVAWLGRLSGIDTSVFENEARAVWKLPSYSYIKTDFIPTAPFVQLAKALSKGNPRYFLRHALYSKRSKRITKQAAMEFLSRFSDELPSHLEKIKENLRKFLHSQLSVVMIREMEVSDYQGYVYDFCVPEAQTFFGGTTPILLHNSDERGIDTVRGKIKDFARTLALSGVPFKIIFLDEADALTADAQQALRRTMEKYSGNTRFCLSANYSSRIIEPVQSRCAVFRLSRLSDEELTGLIETIAKEEDLKMDEKAKKAVVYVADGDARKAINCLQGAAILHDKISEEDIFKVSSRARPEEIEKMVSLALKGNFAEARKLLDEVMIKYGMSGEDVIKQIYREIVKSDLPDKEKVLLVDRVGEYSFRMVEGANERIQLEALLAQIMLHGGAKK